MAFDENLAGRVRRLLADRRDVREVRMFGGLCFMVGGHMCCGVANDDLVLRLGPDAERALAEPGARPMDFTGRPLTGMVFVAGPACAGTQLRRWVQRAVAFAASLPPQGARRDK